MTLGHVAVSFTARQLPELRSDMITVFPTWATYFPASPFVTEGKAVVPRLAQADLFYMTEEFDGLVRASAVSLPSHVLTKHDPPTRSGIVVRPKSEMKRGLLPDGSEDWFISASGFSWLVSDDQMYIGELLDSRLLAHSNGGAPEGYPRTPTLLPAIAGIKFGSDIKGIEAGRNSFAASVVRSLLAFWNLVRQTSIAETVHEPVRRPERRRLERAGNVPPQAVRVIYLRGRQGGGQRPDEATRDYHHQWIVRGHWRQQWYPSLQDRRPVWIAPHIKGPEGAPLLGGEKVYVADAVTAGASVGGDS